MIAVDPQIIERVRARKSRRRSLVLRYRNQNKLAFLVHSFNRIRNIDSLYAGLKRLGKHELIVCDDGSIDGSLEKWTSLLDEPNDFLLRANDLHEIRLTDRAIRFARAEIVCLVQDDDHIPDGTEWLQTALARFKSHPKLAVLGGFMGFQGFDPNPTKSRPVWGETEFRFVHHVNIGPYFIRRSAYQALGGWDYSFSRPGEPGICFDNELCLRAWCQGYQVGYSFIPFKGPAGHYSLDGGTVLFDGATRRTNQMRNQRKIFDMYSGDTERLDTLVAEANRSLNRPVARS